MTSSYGSVSALCSVIKLRRSLFWV